MIAPTRIRRVVSPAPRAAWQAALEADPDALVSQTPAWIDCLCAAGGYEDASRLYEADDGRQLILPMVRRRHVIPSLASEASLPSSWGIGGLIAAQPVGAPDVASVFSDLARSPAVTIALRPNPLAATVWAAARPDGVIAVQRTAHVLDLRGGFAHVWSRQFAGETRNQVRKAERSGLTVECDTAGRLVPVYYDLWLRSVDRWARNQHEPRALARWRGNRRDPLSKIKFIAERLGEACRLWVAWHGGRPAAAILVLQGRNAHYTRGAMDKSIAAPTCANYLLHRLAIEEACRAGCRYYHLGDTGSSAALAHFKSRLGGRAQAYSEFRLERLPITQADSLVRRAVKRLIGFKDV